MKPISDEKRAKRLAGVNFARGSVRLEGFVLNDEVESITARYVGGELTLEEHTAAILRLYKK